MFENYHPVHFLAHYLDTSVFSPLTQTQFFSLIPSVFSNLYSLAAPVVFCTAVAILWCLKINRGQIHY